jgi:hypothetical protein
MTKGSDSSGPSNDGAVFSRYGSVDVARSGRCAIRILAGGNNRGPGRVEQDCGSAGVEVLGQAPIPTILIGKRRFSGPLEAFLLDD